MVLSRGTYQINSKYIGRQYTVRLTDSCNLTSVETCSLTYIVKPSDDWGQPMKHSVMANYHCCWYPLHICISSVYYIEHFIESVGNKYSFIYIYIYIYSLFPYSHINVCPVSHFNTPWKRQKTYSFPTFSGGIKVTLDINGLSQSYIHILSLINNTCVLVEIIRWQERHKKPSIMTIWLYFHCGPLRFFLFYYYILFILLLLFF